MTNYADSGDYTYQPRPVDGGDALGSKTKLMGFKVSPADAERIRQMAAFHKISVAELLRSIALREVEQSKQAAALADVPKPGWTIATSVGDPPQYDIRTRPERSDASQAELWAAMRSLLDNVARLELRVSELEAQLADWQAED